MQLIRNPQTRKQLWSRQARATRWGISCVFPKAHDEPVAVAEANYTVDYDTMVMGTMADESINRRDDWLRNGCNAFDTERPKSKPMSFWTEQDVLQYIHDYDIEIAPVYGEVKQDSKGKFYTTGCHRTGCVFCMFGCHLEKEPNRFQQLKQTHPKLYDYCIRSEEDGGLGLGEVLDFIHVNYK